MADDDAPPHWPGWVRRPAQSIAEIPKDIRDLYKTAWEISQVRP